MNWFSRKIIYLDYAAATPMLPEVRREMEKYFSKDFYNPNAIYAEGEKVRKKVEEYRTRIAKILGVSKETIIFTSGGTEANVLAVRGVRPGKIVAEPGSHPSVLEAVIENNSKEITLISSVTTDNKLGRKIREERKKNDPPAGGQYPLLHIDASQTAQYFNIGLEHLACDLITLDGAKLYGPKGIGALIVRKGVELNLPPRGTPPVPLIAGFAKALEMAERDREAEFKRLDSMSASFVEGLGHALPQARVTRTLPNIINVSVPDILPEFLVLALDREGVKVSAGPACDANKPEPADAPVRFSLGRHTSKKDLDRAVKIFCRVIENMLKFPHAAV